ncbi:MAG: hypothetical protein A3C43_07345 [Candidatus Schekmanbacteria bacterium RIFCSPHIGHO2_02_FULL_38_11]|uniref:Uncharacterized protein n=1 Tax=Candidatus Schekmanbacteria bacterium RIFCSPLOWO2_12_FULL_38_15 TaxID=1817883 RepID=A0A1F7SL79_9BACT|nr:MAG: hypothetical protein A2043_07040 [Candidatus Schekmanbacteria bacterium GWA2_38_9]OGL47990.1 MAG: hypothetical protein A3H37_08170 [Candidatus Schekmanbacteria bacterium RIFCSPLOWO2_02_FULL_38_14]OGL48428.1 MAG: hypothetical protein A3C43_07345 [Candidatus Schekmanbacteria bacterium RIFCSPHIGHO2_02_FULL_38_11]OGL54525.1 MAG: hypothetical protein A3G31_10220 [Candidatus Schekmanbacteria bacterium RIFCSPLOWO2_12_FULL_38_15]
MSEKKGFKECPFCGKEVEEGIIKCPYCKRIYRLAAESKVTEESPSPLLIKKPRINIIVSVFGFITVALLLFYFYLQKEEIGNNRQKSAIIEEGKSLAFTEKNEARGNKENAEQGLNENVSDQAVLSRTVNANEKGTAETGTYAEKPSPENIRMTGEKRTEAYVLYRKGLSLEKEGKLDLAEKEILASISIDPSIAWAHYRLGIVYLKKGMDDNALREFENALKVDKKIVFAHYQIGKIYQKREDMEKALNEFQKSVEIDSSFSWAHYRLSVIYKIIGREELSRKEYEIYSTLKGNTEEFEE